LIDVPNNIQLIFAKEFASTHILLPQKGHEFIEFLKFIGVIKT